jgi:hypothetical protein
MSTCIVKSVGIAAPGLAGWNASLDVLRGVTAHVTTPESPYAPALLPPNERRRATAAVRQAFRAAEDAVAGFPANNLASVFASSDADMSVLNRICSALAQSPRVISPTDFHNSVHNAASGYWSIAVQSMQPTTTLAAFDASFTAGLVEAVALVRERNADVLLAAYDAVAPEPLLAARPLGHSASVALVLGADPAGDEAAGTKPLARLELGFAGTAESRCSSESLEALRCANPALRALPLLELMAAGRAGAVTLRGPGELLVTVDCAPWT